jgi:polyisoprenoid-binding protein YceI
MTPRFLSTSCLLLVCFIPSLRAAERPLSIDLAQSHVDVAVKASVDSFVAHLTQYEPSVIMADDGSVTSARLAFHFRDVVTGKASRDKAMHEWQHTDSFPDGTFVLSSLQPAADTGYTAFGRLTLHGVTRDIQFPISLSRDGTRLAIDGDAAVDTRDFDLPIIRMFGVLKVNPLVRVRFHLQGDTSVKGEVRS